jgi:hypothetical protein
MQFTSFPFISLLLAPVLITARLSVTNIRGNYQQQLDERNLVPKTSSLKAPAPKWAFLLILGFTNVILL